MKNILKSCIVFVAVLALPYALFAYGEAEVRTAMKNGEFTAYMQPIKDLQTKEILSAEALSRWIKDGKTISPGEYIPNIENTSFMTEFDLYMIKLVASFVGKNSDISNFPPIEVNLSRNTLAEPGISEDIIDLVLSERAAPALIGIEVTETYNSEEMDIVSANVKNLKKAGFRIYLDDYGAGYSKKSDIKQINPDIIKLDRSFVPKTIEDILPSKPCKYVAPIIKTAAKKDIKILVEGIETQDQIDWALSCSIRVGQGYFLGKPMPEKDFLKLLND